MSFYYPDESYNKTMYDQQFQGSGGYAPQNQNQNPYAPQSEKGRLEQAHRTGRGQPRPPPGNDDFMISFCKCGGPCTEAWCCYWCQISRQYNIIFNEKQGINWGVCALLTFLDLCVLDMVGMACQCYLRTRLRRRYNMKDSNCGDCCRVFWCPCCALSQAHWELAVRGDNPGATCPCGNADVTTVMR